MGLVWIAAWGIFFVPSAPVLAQEPPAAAAGVQPAPEPPAGSAVEPSAQESPEEPLDFKDPFFSGLPVKEGEVSEEPVAGGTEAAAEPEEQFDPAKYQVTGLVWGQAAPKAIINDTIYSIGDTVEGAKVVNIDKNGILMEFNSKEYLMKREGGATSEQGGE